MTRKLAVASIFAVGCVIFYFGVIFTGQLPDHPLISGYNDLLLHATAFGLLTFVTLLTLPRLKAALGGLFLFAGFIELVQLALPDRTASLLDLLASFAGIVISWVLVVTIAEMRQSLPDRKRRSEERVDV